MKGTNVSMQPQYQYQQPYPVQGGYAAPQRTEDSVGSWMLTIFLLGIPVVGFIYVLILAFGADTGAKKNYARATLIWMAIGIVISTIILVIMLASGAAFFNFYVGSSSPSSSL